MNVALHVKFVIRREGRIGVLLIQDKEGLVIAALKCIIKTIKGNIPQMHATLLLIALQLAKDIGMQCLDIEDCWQELFRMFATGGPSLANHGVLVDHIGFLAKQFQFISFSVINAS